jgi:cytochrome b561
VQVCACSTSRCVPGLRVEAGERQAAWICFWNSLHAYMGQAVWLLDQSRADMLILWLSQLCASPVVTRQQQVQAMLCILAHTTESSRCRAAV